MEPLFRGILIVMLLPLYESCMRVYPVEPGIPACIGCKCCAANLIALPRDQGAISQPMTDEMTVTTGACAVRTFTCTSAAGHPAAIVINGGEEKGGGDWPGMAPDPSTSSLPVTCDAAGSTWLFMNIPITSVECTYAP